MIIEVAEGVTLYMCRSEAPARPLAGEFKQFHDGVEYWEEADDDYDYEE